MNRAIVPWVLTVFLSAPVFADDTIGFIEDFSLAKNREEELKQLIPATPDYYYYHCLHYQNLGNLKKVDDLLKQWGSKNWRQARPTEIRNRQALLKYATDNPNDSVTEAGLDAVSIRRVHLDPGLWADAYSFSAAAGTSASGYQPGPSEISS